MQKLPPNPHPRMRHVLESLHQAKLLLTRKLLTFLFLLTCRARLVKGSFPACVSICMHVSVGLPRHTDTEAQTAPSTAAHLAVAVGS